MPAAETDVEGRILRAIARGAHVDPARLRPEATLEALAISSLDVVNVIFEIEDEFGIEVPTERDDELKTVGHVIAKIKGILAARRAG